MPGRDAGEALTVPVPGDFDLQALGPQVDRLMVEGRTRLAFDLGEVDFINSTALGFILRTRQRLLEHGGTLVLFAPSASVQRTMHLLGLDEVLLVFESEEGAIRYLKEGTV